MKSQFFNILLITSLILSAYCPLKADNQDTSISVIIPCIPKHFSNLEPLLDHYCQQTLLPNEVIISLSQADQVDREEIDALRGKEFPFLLKILTANKKKYAGTNRNLAALASTGDLIVCQDADDVPHPQRLEIVKYLYVNVGFDSLIHGYTHFSTPEDYEKESLILTSNRYRMTDLTYRYNPDILWIHSDDNPRIFNEYVPLHIGNVVITREVFKTIQWGPEALQEDLHFGMRFYNLFQNNLVLKQPLIFYRHYKSSWR